MSTMGMYGRIKKRIDQVEGNLAAAGFCAHQRRRGVSLFVHDEMSLLCLGEEVWGAGLAPADGCIRSALDSLYRCRDGRGIERGIDADELIATLGACARLATSHAQPASSVLGFATDAPLRPGRPRPVVLAGGGRLLFGMWGAWLPGGERPTMTIWGKVHLKRYERP